MKKMDRNNIESEKNNKVDKKNKIQNNIKSIDTNKNYYQDSISNIINQLKGYQNLGSAPIIYEIERSLEKTQEFNQKQIIQEFNENENEDSIDFRDQSILNYLKQVNFSFSENSKNKLNTLYFYIKNGYHILITGNTGTGKSYLSEVVCEILQKNIIKYNCSENSKFSDLVSISIEEKKNINEIKYINGPLLKALNTKNSVFIMDNANLASVEVLNSLESIIDSGYIAYEEKDKLIKKSLDKEFCFILTVNPNKEKFYGKRKELPESFKNKFISIEFPEMTNYELYDIAIGKSKALEVNGLLKDYKKFTFDLISFHVKWSKNKKIQDNVACLTIRDILSVLDIISKKEEPIEAIMNIYGSRYIEPIKREMREIIFKYESFKKYNTNYKKNYDKIKNEFPKSCFKNTNTLELIYSCIFSLKYGRHPLIAGNYGTGKKFLACQLADYFNECINKKYVNKFKDFSIHLNLNFNTMNSSSNNILLKDEEQLLYIVYCTKNCKVEDLIGKPRVLDDKNKLIHYQDGPLI